MAKKGENILAKAASELEASIRKDEKQAESAEDFGTALAKSIKGVVNEFFGKSAEAKPIEKVKDAKLTDAEDETDMSARAADSGVDSAAYDKDRKPSYKKSTKKGEECDEEEDDDDDDKPSFFEKMKSKKKEKAYKGHGKKMKKSEEAVEEDDEVIDATEALDNMQQGMVELHKSISDLEEGMAVFGELVTELTNPSRDKLLGQIAKGMAFLIEEHKELKKSVADVNTLAKSLQTAGMPRIAGHTLPAPKDDLSKSENPTGKTTLSKGEQDRLFAAAAKGQITREEFNHALRSNDTSILKAVGAK